MVLFGMPFFSAASRTVSFLEMHSSTALTRFYLQKIIILACIELSLVYPRHGKRRLKKAPFENELAEVFVFYSTLCTIIYFWVRTVKCTFGLIDSTQNEFWQAAMAFPVRPKLPHEMSSFGFSNVIPTTIKLFFLFWVIDDQWEQHDTYFQQCNHYSAAWGAEAYKRFYYYMELSPLIQTRPLVNFKPYYSFLQL